MESTNENKTHIKVPWKQKLDNKEYSVEHL
jgi:hypothetical protein